MKWWIFRCGQVFFLSITPTTSRNLSIRIVLHYTGETYFILKLVFDMYDPQKDRSITTVYKIHFTLPYLHMVSLSRPADWFHRFSRKFWRTMDYCCFFFCFLFFVFFWGGGFNFFDCSHGRVPIAQIAYGTGLLLGQHWPPVGRRRASSGSLLYTIRVYRLYLWMKIENFLTFFVWI